MPAAHTGPLFTRLLRDLSLTQRGTCAVAVSQSSESDSKRGRQRLYDELRCGTRLRCAIVSCPIILSVCLTLCSSAVELEWAASGLSDASLANINFADSQAKTLLLQHVIHIFEARRYWVSHDALTNTTAADVVPSGHGSTLSPNPQVFGRERQIGTVLILYSLRL